MVFCGITSAAYKFHSAEIVWTTIRCIFNVLLLQILAVVLQEVVRCCKTDSSVSGKVVHVTRELHYACIVTVWNIHGATVYDSFKWINNEE